MISKAIEIEKQYQHIKLTTDREESLISLLNPLGYETLEQYFTDKIDYQINQLEVYKYTGNMLNIPKEINNAIASKTPTIFLPYAKRRFIWHGNEEIDMDLCSELNIDILTLNYFGGNIVSGPGDFSMGLLVPKTIDVTFEYFLNRYANFYKKFFSDVTIDNNDILINNKKIQGSIFFDSNDMYFFGTAISFIDRTNLIKKICKKQSVKIPGYINKNILSKDTLYREVSSWVQ